MVIKKSASYYQWLKYSNNPNGASKLLESIAFKASLNDKPKNMAKLKKRSGKCKINHEYIKAIRVAKEFCNVKNKVISEITGEDQKNISKICSYVTRSNLTVNENDMHLWDKLKNGKIFRDYK